MVSRRRFEDSDSNDSDGSVSSTWTTQSKPKDSYPVDEILAEKEDEESHEMLYLVKWTGYEKSRCTWEPAENLDGTGGVTLDQWVRDKNAIKLGFKTAFPLATWERNQRLKAENDNRRWQRRKAMLKKRSNWAEPPEGHPACEDSSDNEGSEPLGLSPPKRRMSPGAGRKSSAIRARSRLQAAAGRNTGVTQEKRRGAEIMTDYAKEPPTKRIRKPADENQQYKSASHRWNVEKKGRDGAVPRVEDIQALLAKPGEIHSLPQSDATRVGSQSGPSRAESCRDVAPNGPIAPHAETVPLTCFYWHNGLTCPSGQDQCRFTHGEFDRIAEHELHQQVSEEGTTGWKPKFWNPTKVCFFWNKPGGCHQGDTGCWFAHWIPKKVPWVVHRANDDKRYPTPLEQGNHVAPQSRPVPPSGPRSIPYERTRAIIKQPCHFWETGACRDGAGCKWMHGHIDPAIETAPQPTFPKSTHVSSKKLTKTCPYWYYRGDCIKTAESCEFAHEKLAEVAAFKSSHNKICPYWYNGRCSKSADDCKFLHQHVEGAPIGEIPFGRPRNQIAQSTSKCDSYRPSPMRHQFPGDQLEAVLTSSDSTIPQAPPSFFDQAYQIASSGYSTFGNGFSAPEGPAGYTERLAQESAERANRKIQVIQAHTPQSSPLTTAPAEPILYNPPPVLADLASDSSSEAMDVDSGIMESPDTLDTIDSPTTLRVSLQVSDAFKFIPVDIVDLEFTAIDALKTDYSREPQIVVSKMVMRDLLETYIFPLAPTVLSSGKIFEMQGQDMPQLARTLTEQSSVAIAQGPSSLLIFYPSQFILEERVFLERGKTPIEPNCHICVQVRAIGRNFPTAIPNSSSASLPRSLERYFHKNHGWEPARFFAWTAGKQTTQTKRNVYIMAHHISHKAEIEMLARYFREIGAQVWTTGTKGSWDNFLNIAEDLDGSGVIILHPDFVRYEGIPNLRRLLLKSFNIFQIRVSMKQGLPEKLTMKKIMPTGTCTLLADEMYIKFPQESLDLLKVIVKKNEGKKKKTDRTWGLYGPPQLAPWLFNFCLAKEAEGEEDSRKLEVRMALYDKLQQIEDDEDDPGAPLLFSDIEIDASQIPNGVPDDHTAFDAYRSEDPAGAARKLLEAFATASLEWTEQYRRVVVIIPPSELVDPELKKVYDEWEASPKAQHISFGTPDWFMRKFPVR